ncbi:MAG: hypothetical protein P8016_13495 [Sedimentisphaerales bacterium]
MNHHSQKSKKLILLLISIQIIFSTQQAYSETFAEGVVLTPLTADGKSEAVSWAYHGDLLSFVRTETGTQYQLMVMKSDGSSKQRVSPMGNPFFAEWSWKGDKISYEFSNTRDRQSQGGIYVYDLSTGKTISISPPYPENAIDSSNGPFWSANGRFLAYAVRPGTTRQRQVFVAEAQTGKYQRILADRGQGREQRWSPAIPPKLCLLTEAGGGGYDLTVVDPYGKGLVILTDNGGRSIDIDNPRWSPDGKWIAYTSDLDMTQSERDIGGFASRTDCWISKPDNSEARNLTKASSSATEEQLSLGDLIWSWHSRWILSEGSRFDNQGNSISTVYLIDPINGGYEPIITSYPRKTGQVDMISLLKWSYDSTKILVVSNRYGVKNWGPQSQYENPRSVLRGYHNI